MGTRNKWMVQGAFLLLVIGGTVSGLLDTFDGKVARSKKNRTEDEKLYGIQLDSLADVICFGVFPAMICYLMGVRGLLGGVAIAFYGLCGVIRLAYFNVLETGRQADPEAGEKVYHGLPITSIAVILPLTFLLGFLVPGKIFPMILLGMLFLVGLLFIVDFKLRKPKNWMLAVLIVLVAAAVLVIILYSRHYIPQMNGFGGWA